MLPFKYSCFTVIKIKFTKKHNLKVDVTFRETGLYNYYLQVKNTCGISQIYNVEPDTLQNKKQKVETRLTFARILPNPLFVRSPFFRVYHYNVCVHPIRVYTEA